jgi:hypothetical protein
MLEFTHNHSTDLKLICQAIVDKEPIVFARFADGERAAIEGKKCGTDGWKIHNNRQLASSMMESISYNHPNYYVGISCPCCDLSSNKFYKKIVGVPHSHISYSTIFANGNTEEAFSFFSTLTKSADIVGCKNEATIKIQRNMLQPFVDPTETLEQIANSDKEVVLLAAGPYSCVLAHQYLVRNFVPKTIIDVGSALDGIYGRVTRRYHQVGHRNRNIVCKDVV